MIYFIAQLLIRAAQILFGKDAERYFDKFSDTIWYRIAEIAIMGAFLWVIYYVGRISVRALKGDPNYLVISPPEKRRSVAESAKSPYSRPDFSGERATGSCPNCGHPYVYAKRSFRTGELYFSCGSTRIYKPKKCDFKGCRSY